jgi:hypothetical protein
MMIVLAVLLAACASKVLTLPADPIDRAATCGVVAAVQARAATPDIKAPLSFDSQGRIIHYALLAASTDGAYAADTAVAVNKRMAALQKPIIDGKWQVLVPPCHAAFPVADATEVKLPADRLEAQLGCVALGDFLTTAMADTNADYDKELSEYLAFERTLDRSSMPSTLRGRVGGNLESQQKLRRRALAKVVQGGSPGPMMRECIRRFA